MRRVYGTCFTHSVRQSSTLRIASIPRVHRKNSSKSFNTLGDSFWNDRATPIFSYALMAGSVCGVLYLGYSVYSDQYMYREAEEFIEATIRNVGNMEQAHQFSFNQSIDCIKADPQLAQALFSHSRTFYMDNGKATHKLSKTYIFRSPGDVERSWQIICSNPLKRFKSSVTKKYYSGKFYYETSVLWNEEEGFHVHVDRVTVHLHPEDNTDDLLFVFGHDHLKPPKDTGWTQSRELHFDLASFNLNKSDILGLRFGFF
jgi:hypothetical protein